MDEELIKKAFVEGFKKELEKIALGWLGTLGLHVGIPAVLSFVGGMRRPRSTAGGMQIAPRG
jgi:hypothetical protein